MKVKAIKTRVFREHENLVDFIKEHLRKISENSVLVVTSKIVALSEGRVVDVSSQKQKEKIIKKESSFAIKTKWAWLTIKDGVVMASAGIDESNANGKLILLPKNSFKSAFTLRNELKKKYGLKNFGILITDSRTTPLRKGVTGQAIGYAGFKGLKSYIGKPDIFKRKFSFSTVNIADSLATSAVLEMGEGNEKCPLAIIQSNKIKFIERTNKDEIKISIKDDMYRPLFKRL